LAWGLEVAVCINTAHRILVKTSIDLADDLAATFKKKTAQEGISLRAAVHEALRLWLSARTSPSRPKPIERKIGIM